MPLPQQDEFGGGYKVAHRFFDKESQCRFRSKMNSECSRNYCSICLYIKVSMPLPQQDEFGANRKVPDSERGKWVSMPLPQQDEFGVLSEKVANIIELVSLNAASAAR